MHCPNCQLNLDESEFSKYNLKQYNKICDICRIGKYCIHRKEKYYCRICGNAYCKHNKRKTFCIECGGSGLCEHLKHRYRCVKCKLLGIDVGGVCNHNKRRDSCKLCKT